MSGSWMVRSRLNYTPIAEGGKTVYNLCRRDWDGYDKPDYVEILRVHKEELDDGGFNVIAGRFERFIGWYSSQEGLLDFMKKDYPEIACLDNYSIMADRISETVQWISDNTNGEWAMGVEEPTARVLRTFSFAFTNPADATAFKLKWS